MNIQSIRSSRQAHGKPQRGIALIEALVGMLIFSFGVLGLVGLQASMTQAQTSARFRAEAANLASELFGLIQTDHSSRLNLYAADTCADYLRCSDWLRKMRATLPAGQSTLNTNVNTGSVVLTISWLQGNSGRNSYTTSMIWQP